MPIGGCAFTSKFGDYPVHCFYKNTSQDYATSSSILPQFNPDIVIEFKTLGVGQRCRVHDRQRGPIDNLKRSVGKWYSKLSITFLTSTSTFLPLSLFVPDE
jgi:hypothetical protein